MKKKGKTARRGKAGWKIFSVTAGMAALGTLFSGCLGFAEVPQTGRENGVYEGTGQGYRGPVHVKVWLSPAGIEDITIIRHEEEMYPGAAAMEELLDLVLTEGTTDLDAVSGATYSSRGFLEAVENALEKSAQQERKAPAS